MRFAAEGALGGTQSVRKGGYVIERTGKYYALSDVSGFDGGVRKKYTGTLHQYPPILVQSSKVSRTKSIFFDDRLRLQISNAKGWFLIVRTITIPLLDSFWWI